jgi:energy-coupling factor transporter ATP-binding protein EcfA2
MIRRIRFVHYKGFSDFSLFLKGTSLLVGPNNAGKTTIIAALRLCAYLIRQAQSRKPDRSIRDESRGKNAVGYRMAVPVSQFVEENVRHEFRELETRLEIIMTNGASLYAVWPMDDEAYFYLEHIEGMQPRTIQSIKEFYPNFGIIPTLAPVEHRELILSEKYVRDNLSTRLASRHFRNQMYLQELSDPAAYEQLKKYIVDHTPEIEYLDVTATMTGDGERELDLYYCETMARTEKEFYWAGDGLQIWLQVLFHIWRQIDIPVLILDEPDVFLHPDLQRRLVRALEELNTQVILATHAPELIAEVSRDSVILVDRTRKRSKRISDDKALASLNNALGSGFNLRLVKALRSRVVLFVEGQDMKILANIAKTLGADRFAGEKGLAIVPMGGYSNRGMASAFGWMNSRFLEGAVDVFVVIDRDYRSDDTARTDAEALRKQGVHAHVWRRKELENYLLVPEAIARLARLEVRMVRAMLDGAIADLRVSIQARYLTSHYEEKRSSGAHQNTINERSLLEFDELWSDPDWRLRTAPPKEVLSGLNQSIQAAGGRAVNARKISAALKIEEISDEMTTLILDVETSLGQSRDV